MKKLLIFVLLPLMLLGGGGAGLFFSGILGGEETEEVVEEAPKKRVREFREIPFFHELADMVLSVRDEENRRRFMIMKVAIEVDTEADIEFLKFHEAKVRDQILVLMSRQDMEVLSDVNEIYQLREKLENSIFDLFEEDNSFLLGVDIRNVRIQ